MFANESSTIIMRPSSGSPHSPTSRRTLSPLCSSRNCCFSDFSSAPATERQSVPSSSLIPACSSRLSRLSAVCRHSMLSLASRTRRRSRSARELLKARLKTRDRGVTFAASSSCKNIEMASLWLGVLLLFCSSSTFRSTTEENKKSSSSNLSPWHSSSMVLRKAHSRGNTPSILSWLSD